MSAIFAHMLKMRLVRNTSVTMSMQAFYRRAVFFVGADLRACPLRFCGVNSQIAL